MKKLRSETFIMSIRETVKRYLFFIFGLFLMAVGVALSTRSNLGTSPISAVPYVLSFRIAYDDWAIYFLMNLLFIAFQISLIKKTILWIQLLQIVVAIIFGFFYRFYHGVIFVDKCDKLSSSTGVICIKLCNSCSWSKYGSYC